MIGLTNFKLNHYFYRDCSLGWHLDEHIFPRNSLSLVLRGNIKYTINHVTYFVEKNDLVFVKAGSLRKAEPSKDCIFIAIDFELDHGDFELAPVTKVNISDRANELLQSLEYSWLQKNESESLKSQLLFLNILYELLYSKAADHKNRHVEEIKRYILEHFSETITVEKLADIVELNPGYCGALFKQEENKTILEYVNLIRINQATTLLSEGSYNVSQVANLCGFSDVYYFSKTFKKLIGISPKKYWSQNQYF